LLDFRELGTDGQDFELLLRELIFRLGFSVYWSGKGVDGGRDLVCIEKRGSFFAPDERRWLIQCKHNAHSGKSVGINDLGEIADSCIQHNCHAYLLACSTYPSSAVVNRLEGISNNTNNQLVATYWDSVKIEQLLSTPRNWALAQRFFPVSAQAENWQIYATESPNEWVVIYKGYYFHLKNRVGSHRDYHLGSIKLRINDLEKIVLPDKHFLRPRSVYFDDKNGNYEWYIDYMYPNDQRPVKSTAQIAEYLGDSYALEDGQLYTFHVKHRSYLEQSDHYDPDHYTYYHSDDIPRHGGPRPFTDFESYSEAIDSKEELIENINRERNRGFNALCTSLESISFIKLVQKCNSYIEDLDRFYVQRNWSEIIEELEIVNDRFFSAWFLILVYDDDRFHDLISKFPLDTDRYFRLTRAHIYLPSDDSSSSVRSDEEGQLLYELTLSIHPSCIGNKVSGRSLLNEYFLELEERISKYEPKR
jgi:hypothetical protein